MCCVGFFEVDGWVVLKVKGLKRNVFSLGWREKVDGRFVWWLM